MSKEQRPWLWVVLGFLSLALGGGLLAWWLTRDPARLILRGHKGPVHAVAVSHDGTRLATGGADQSVRLWELPSGKSLVVFKDSGSAVLALAFSPDGKTLAAGFADGKMRLYDVTEERERFAGVAHRGGVHALAFAPDGTTVASAGSDKLVRLWHPATSKPITAWKGHQGRVRALAWSGDGKRLASGGSGDNAIRVWAVGSSRPIGEYKGHTRRVHSLAFGSAGQLYSGDRTGTVKVWNTVDHSPVSFEAHQGPVNALVAGKESLFTGGEDGVLKRWPLTDLKGKSLTVRHRGTIEALAVTEGGQTVVTASSDGKVRVYDAPR